ncbi:hypothetical protein M9458_052047 [Cirrhinus mrigala]|uniref:Retrotransposon gag domain-containing protein n=1 Tax=Cirrhinus mrigala TaxID=683832 RepID=A0ABD0MQJ7_CIRMR
MIFRKKGWKRKEECEGKVTASHKSTNPFDVFISPHVPPPYHHYPVAELQALKVDPDLDCSPPRRPIAPPARAPAPPVRPAVQPVMPTAPYPQMGAVGGQEEEGDPEIIPETPNEEVKEERTCRLPPSKKRKTRNTVKKDNVSITALMVEVSGPDGVMMVFRPWTVNDIREAMALLPNPEEAGDRFSTELVTFCKEFSPTMYELRRLLAVKLGASNWHKVSGKLRGEDYRRVSSNWTDEANAIYCTAVAELAEAIKVAFPACVNTSKIGNCCQTREESVQDYYHRLYETFNKHSGLDEPDDRGNQPGTWECHLRSWFLNGLRPEIAQTVKGNYIEWKNGRLAAILAHALHAEEQQATKKERARAKTDKDL